MASMVPNIRFNGFTEPWKQRKLGDLFNVVDTKHATAPITDVKTKYRMIRTDCVRNGQLIEKNTDSVTKDVYEKWSERIRLQPGDLVFTREAPMGESAVIPYDDNYYFPGQRIVSLRSKGNVDTLFINNLIYGERFRKEIRIREAGSSTVANFGIPAIKDYYVLVPEYEEQQKIGCYLNKINNLITLHQRRCDTLKELKKGMLQKMFPKEGANVPEFRFKGFTEDWEQRKLGDITSKIGSGKTPSGGAEAYVEAGTPLIRSQNVHDNMVDLSDVVFIDDETNKTMENSVVSTDDVLLNITGASIGRSAVYKGTEPANVNQHVCIIRPVQGYYPDFIQLHISSANGQKQIDYSQAGGAREGLNFQQIGKFKFAFPSYEEQAKIGSYFRSLDNLITLYQRKCDDLKEVRKYMLQNMFP